MNFIDEVKDRELFDMYHSRTTDKVKSKILSTIKEPNSTLRIIIATNAVGMGLDFQSNHVIHYGPPSEYDAYLQQIGRVGRDGSACHAMLLYHSKQLRKVSPEMLSFVSIAEEKSYVSCMVTKH
jgi:superfamily II DNA helicase RecQ